MGSVGCAKVGVEMARWYVATDEVLKGELLEFERRFGIDSFELRRLHIAGEAPDRIDPFDRAVWLGALERWEEVRARKRAKAPAGSRG